jgi:hypothetical protein
MHPSFKLPMIVFRSGNSKKSFFFKNEYIIDVENFKYLIKGKNFVVGSSDMNVQLSKK